MTERSIPELLELLGSPDPHLRDDVAYLELAERITSGAEDGRLSLLGDRLSEFFSDERIQARSFASLVLAEVVLRASHTGEVGRETLRGWLGEFSDWYRTEEDLRGFDATLGWLHAVAHGADAIGAFARNRHLQPVELVVLLELARDRVLCSRGPLYADHEEYRLALALALVLARPELSSFERVDWLGGVKEEFLLLEPGPVPARISNAVRTLQALYLFVDRGIDLPGEAPSEVPGRTEVMAALAGVLRQLFAFIG